MDCQAWMKANILELAKKCHRWPNEQTSTIVSSDNRENKRSSKKQRKLAKPNQSKDSRKLKKGKKGNLL